jgi:tRNA/tmRNA/rRNA uracil-C5-methylase (TrmA/RlmC/RlmD family)
MKTLTDFISEQYHTLPHRTLQRGECQTAKNKRCTLCFASRLDYSIELHHKQKAIIDFLDSLKLGVPIRPLIPSPMGRFYRTVSKRKAFLSNRQFSLGLIGVDEDTAKSFPMAVGQCVIEPQIHADVYKVIQEYLQRKKNLSLAEEFNYVIVRGNDAEASVIFNLNHFSSSNRKEINTLSKYLTRTVKNISGVFVFRDEERSRYYLRGNPRREYQTNSTPMFKIFGKEKLFHKVGGVKFLYSPLSFSQTNHSILESFVSAARNFLDLAKDEVLLDLYCGYGLFSFSCAANVRNVLGIELSRASIADALENARINKVTNTKFIPANITVENLQKVLRSEIPNLKLILDPPRSGTAEGVIEFLAQRRPEKVVHIFCNSALIEKELKRWKKSGYFAAAVQPFDLFPGTGEIEVMVLLKSG